LTLKAKVIEALGKITAPGTNYDIISMKIIDDISVSENGRVCFTFKPISPLCPRAFKLASDIKRSISCIEGVNGVDMKVIEYDRADELMNALKN